MCDCKEEKTTPSLNIRFDGTSLIVNYNDEIEVIPLVTPNTITSTDIQVVVAQNGQRNFINVIPSNSTLTSIIYRGVEYTKLDYTITGDSITWVDDIPLKVNDILILKTWHS